MNTPIKQVKGKKVALGLSGGVDSSVAGYLLKQQGYDVTGVYIQCWDKKVDGCAADEDKSYAVQTAAKLGIDFVHLDFISDYKGKVIEHFYEEYAAGRTPNPDVLCNKEIKFGLFFEWATKHKFDYVATGHYARIEVKKDTYYLLKGTDCGKDQSYFLYQLDQDKLERTLFPVGDIKKTEVRKIAADAGLPAFKRPDSVGICFIGEVDIKEFLKQRLPLKPGEVYFTDGAHIGIHEGAWFYTIGQRHGFKVNKYFGRPLYVVSKNVENNSITVGYKENVYEKSFDVTQVHWVSKNPFENGSNKLRCDLRIRHLGLIYNISLTDEHKLYHVESDEKIFGVAPGQSAVFYDGDVVLGGGIISQTL